MVIGYRDAEVAHVELTLDSGPFSPCVSLHREMGGSSTGDGVRQAEIRCAERNSGWTVRVEDTL